MVTTRAPLVPRTRIQANGLAGRLKAAHSCGVNVSFVVPALSGYCFSLYNILWSLTLKSRKTYLVPILTVRLYTSQISPHLREPLSIKNLGAKLLNFYF